MAQPMWATVTLHMKNKDVYTGWLYYHESRSRFVRIGQRQAAAVNAYGTLKKWVD